MGGLLEGGTKGMFPRPSIIIAGGGGGRAAPPLPTPMMNEIANVYSSRLHLGSAYLLCSLCLQGI